MAKAEVPCPPSGAEIGHRILSENFIYVVQVLTCSAVNVNVNICLFTDFTHRFYAKLDNILATAKGWSWLKSLLEYEEEMIIHIFIPCQIFPATFRKN